MTNKEICDFMEFIMDRACTAAKAQGFMGKTHRHGRKHLSDEVALGGFVQAYADGCVRLLLAPREEPPE